MTHRDRLLKYLRDLAGLSQDQLQRATHVDKHYISGAEHHGDHLCTPQWQRLCEALGWTGEPSDLWKYADEVEDVEGKIDWERLGRLRELGDSGKLGRRRRSRKRDKDICRDACDGCDGTCVNASGAVAAEGAL